MDVIKGQQISSRSIEKVVVHPLVLQCLITRKEMSGVSMAVMTLNLAEGEEGGNDSPNAWDRRKEICVSVIANCFPTILFTQQGLKW